MGPSFPLPSRATLLLAPGTLSMIVSAACLLPTDCGANRTWIVQVSPTAIASPVQPSAATRKSALCVPVVRTRVTRSAASPVLCTVMVRATEVVPTPCGSNEMGPAGRALAAVLALSNSVTLSEV